MKRLVQLSLIGFLMFSCALLIASTGALAQQGTNDQSTLTLQHVKEQLKQNQQYLNEAKKRGKAGDAEGLNTALQNYNRGMEGLNTALSHAGIQGSPSQQQDAYNRVQSATSKHLKVLNNLLTSGKITNPHAIAAIQNAITVSQKGQTTALSHLSQLKTQQAMGQANRPGFGQAGGVGRSEGMGRPGGMGGVGGNPGMGGGMGNPGMGGGMGNPGMGGGPPAGAGGGHGR
jgi:hypothetical protein